MTAESSGRCLNLRDVQKTHHSIQQTHQYQQIYDPPPRPLRSDDSTSPGSPTNHAYQNPLNRARASQRQHQRLPSDPDVNPNQDYIDQASLTEAQSIPLQGPCTADLAAAELAKRISDADMAELMTKPLPLLAGWDSYFEAKQLSRRRGRELEQGITQLRSLKRDLQTRNMPTVVHELERKEILRRVEEALGEWAEEMQEKAEEVLGSMEG